MTSLLCNTMHMYGYDSCGEAVLCCSAEALAQGQQLVASGGRTTVASVLAMGMQRFLLEMVCCFSARDDSAIPAADRRSFSKDVCVDALLSIARSSLHARSLLFSHATDSASAAAAAGALDGAMKEQLRLLESCGMVVIDPSCRFVRPTSEGSAVFVSGISLAAAAQLRLDLSSVGSSCSGDELHLLHMLVPPAPAMLPRFDWRVVHDSVWPALDPGAIAAVAAAAITNWARNDDVALRHRR